MNQKKQLPLKCPFCKKDLKRGELKRIQNHYDKHIPGLHRMYECSCRKAKFATWDDDGYVYSYMHHHDDKYAINSRVWLLHEEIYRAVKRNKRWFRKLFKRKDK